MALTDSFLASCRVAINALPELATFRAALVLTVHTREGLAAAYSRAYEAGAPTPAQALFRAIRETVNALADTSGALGLLDRENACRTLTAEYVTAAVRPDSVADETATLIVLQREDQYS